MESRDHICELFQMLWFLKCAHCRPPRPERVSAMAGANIQAGPFSLLHTCCTLTPHPVSLILHLRNLLILYFLGTEYHSFLWNACSI